MINCDSTFKSECRAKPGTIIHTTEIPLQCSLSTDIICIPSEGWNLFYNSSLSNYLSSRKFGTPYSPRLRCHLPLSFSYLCMINWKNFAAAVICRIFLTSSFSYMLCLVLLSFIYDRYLGNGHGPTVGFLKFLHFPVLERCLGVSHSTNLTDALQYDCSRKKKVLLLVT